ncbi:hypothetical protein V1512DRAFT_263318 [Lipomyces arxii]|uniref:uncharacterized protein n=1 Tax=Lipomyces arxii TaxID=56418 RepID=UPI0034CF0B7A
MFKYGWIRGCGGISAKHNVSGLFKARIKDTRRQSVPQFNEDHCIRPVGNLKYSYSDWVSYIVEIGKADQHVQNTDPLYQACQHRPSRDGAWPKLYFDMFGLKDNYGMKQPKASVSSEKSENLASTTDKTNMPSGYPVKIVMKDEQVTNPDTDVHTDEVIFMPGASALESKLPSKADSVETQNSVSVDTTAENAVKTPVAFEKILEAGKPPKIENEGLASDCDSCRTSGEEISQPHIDAISTQADTLSGVIVSRSNAVFLERSKIELVLEKLSSQISESNRLNQHRLQEIQQWPTKFAADLDNTYKEMKVLMSESASRTASMENCIHSIQLQIQALNKLVSDAVNSQNLRDQLVLREELVLSTEASVSKEFDRLISKLAQLEDAVNRMANKSSKILNLTEGLETIHDTIAPSDSTRDTLTNRESLQANLKMAVDFRDCVKAATFAPHFGLCYVYIPKNAVLDNITPQELKLFTSNISRSERKDMKKLCDNGWVIIKFKDGGQIFLTKPAHSLLHSLHLTANRAIGFLVKVGLGSCVAAVVSQQLIWTGIF